jgi:hypothetical protein
VSHTLSHHNVLVVHLHHHQLALANAGYGYQTQAGAVGVVPDYTDDAAAWH